MILYFSILFAVGEGNKRESGSADTLPLKELVTKLDSCILAVKSLGITSLKAGGRLLINSHYSSRI